jgi:hypothetical protein
MGYTGFVFQAVFIVINSIGGENGFVRYFLFWGRACDLEELGPTSCIPDASSFFMIPPEAIIIAAWVDKRG